MGLMYSLLATKSLELKVTIAVAKVYMLNPVDPLAITEGLLVAAVVPARDAAGV
jgi:hypothetical protein